MKARPRAPKGYAEWLGTLTDHELDLRLDADRRLFAQDANGEGFPRLGMCLEELRARTRAEAAELRRLEAKGTPKG